MVKLFAIIAALLAIIAGLKVAIHKKKTLAIGAPAQQSAIVVAVDSSSYIGSFDFQCTPWDGIQITGDASITIQYVNRVNDNSYSDIRLNVYALRTSPLAVSVCSLKPTTCTDGSNVVSIPSCP